MAECLVGFLILGCVAAMVVLGIKGNAAKKRDAREAQEQFEHQKTVFEAWAAERFGPSEVSEARRLRPPDPDELGLDEEEWNRREEILRRLPKKWANEIIRQDVTNRRRQAEQFVSWGQERFGDSWSETCVRLCRLVSANRTPSIDNLADSEIETLNSYLLAETLGGVNPSGAATPVKPEDSSQPVRWTRQNCGNCGAPLLKGQCIYCRTAYAPD